MSVEYRDVVGFPGYRVGTDGSVWSCWTRGTKSCLGDTWRKLKGAAGANGYPVVCLKTDGRPVFKYAHALVLEAFVGPRPPGMECRHLNGNRLDAGVENLCWGTPKENASDRDKHGTQLKGDACRNSKLTKEDVIAIYSLHKANMRSKDIAERFGVDQSAISGIIRGEEWAHLGLPFSSAVRRGELSPKAKLRAADIPKIVAMWRSGTLPREIAASFGVHDMTIRAVLTGKTWKHIPREGNAAGS